MALDAYTLCPGGRDKKIRFCCPDMIKELQQIEKMMEDDQISACLAFIDQLETTRPDCACLNAAKLSMLRALERWDDCLTLAETFYKREPDNPLAASELAMSYAFCDRWPDAISTIVDGIEKCDDTSISGSLLTGLLVVGEKALADGNVIPAVFIGHHLQQFQESSNDGFSLFHRALRAELPIIAKDVSVYTECPDDFPEKELFQKALYYVVLGCWKKALAIFESLIPYNEMFPDIWRNIALLRLCLGNIDGAADALDKFTKCPKCSLEDASDAELLRLCMIPDPLGDQIQIFDLIGNVSDQEKVQECLLSEKKLRAINVDPRQFVDSDQPPPKMVFTLLDRPILDNTQELTKDTISSQIGNCMFFGKQTDREARIELIGIRSNEKDQIVAFFHEILGDRIISWDEPILTRVFSETLARLRPRYAVDNNFTGNAAELRTKLETFFEEDFIEFWCNRPFGLLDGKTPTEAAKDANYHVRILGAIQVLDFWMPKSVVPTFCNSIRQRLGLPTLDPIPVPPEKSRNAPEQQLANGIPSSEDVELPPSFLDDVPVWRWNRIDVKSLPLIALIQGIQGALSFDDRKTATKFCEELMEFPASEVPYRVRAESIRLLIHQAQMDFDTDKMMQLLQQAKMEAAEAKMSDGWVNVIEVPLLLASGDTVAAQHLIAHIMSNHRNEPETMRQLQGLFVSLGLMNPDGTPVAHPDMEMGASQPMQGQAPEPASKLWVPD